MGLLYVHVCDKCGKQVRSDTDKELPYEWVHAQFSARPFGGVERKPSPVTLTWCGNCWSQIRQRDPQLVEEPS